MIYPTLPQYGALWFPPAPDLRSTRPIFVVAGVGTSCGTGGASALEYNIRPIACESVDLHKFVAELKIGGTDAAAFPISDYNYKEVQATLGVWKPFLQITEDEVDRVTDTNVSRAQAIDEERGGKRGTLLFTDATASLRGNTITAAFSAAKFALRSLLQGLNKEFGKENIHWTIYREVLPHLFSKNYLSSKPIWGNAPYGHRAVESA
ncbi:hypothetical protein DFH94DRAFT_686822 [Russula ochroleuca]|uniref:Uncharacterized protein n=1 Tax=Russula ochroleuca TaxID=152965 RepID=A0A9P5JTI5_9AGAM|nr:hypothetical protein DFH94DRAFT_686822 [Russula ochroleuca]